MKDMEYWRQRETCGRERGREQLIILHYPTLTSYIQKIISYNCKIHQPCIQHKIPGHFNNSNATRQHQLGPGSGNVKVAAVKGTCLRFSETRAARPHAAGPPTVWQVQRVYAQSSQTRQIQNLCTPGCPTQRPPVFNKNRLEAIAGPLLHLDLD